MSELYFRLGEMKGFTAIDLADKKEGYTNLIRELMQNSLDASRDAGNSKCQINIYIEKVPKREIPHIAEYEEVLKKAIQTAKSQGSFNANSKQRVAPIQEALKENNLKVLMFSDNGIGMKQDQLEAILTGGVSIKGGEGSGGSFGVGHLSSYSLSSLRYVLYATKYKDNANGAKMLFTGSPILAGHRDGEGDQRGNRGRIIKQKPDKEMNPDFVYLEKFPDFIQPKMDKIDTGTVVAILGLSEDWGSEAEYAIVSNFFHGIVHDALKIKIHREGQESKCIDIDEVESIVKRKKEVRRARGENILSGKAVYQALQAVVTGDQREITLSNSDKVHVCIKTDKETDPAIVLIRNGMLIARHDSMLSRDMDGLRKTSDFEPFTAVIDVDKQDAPKLFQLVKDAESPYHNKLQAKILGSADEKCLKDWLKELSEEIKKHLNRIERDSFDFPLFQIPNQAETNAGGNYKSSGQNDKAKPQKRTNRPPPKKETEKGNGKNRPKPVVISRNLESKNAVRYTDKAGKWEVKLRITPNKMDDKDDVYLSMCLAEDNDNENTKVYLDFITVQIDGQTINIPDFINVKKDGELIQEPANKSQVKLGPLKQTCQYGIIAEVKKPSEKIGNMKVALLPILGLKQRRNSEE